MLKPLLLALALGCLGTPAATAQSLLPASKAPTRAGQNNTVLPSGTPTIITSDGVTLYTKVAGQGLPCVFVHGGPGAGSQSIEALAGKGLEENLQMIYLDQRGSGRSASDPNKNYTLDRLVLDLDELRQQLHLERWVVMSHSFGGLIATAYAQKYPQHVQGLILVNSILSLPASMESTATYGYTLLPTATRPPLDPAAPLPQRFGMVMGLLNQQQLMSKLMYANDSTEARLKKATKGVATNRDFATVLFQSGAITGYLQDFAATSASLNMPVLVLTGREDYVVGPDHYKSFRFPHQEVVVLPGKHVGMVENPKETNAAIKAFAHKLPRKG